MRQPLRLSLGVLSLSDRLLLELLRLVLSLLKVLLGGAGGVVKRLVGSLSGVSGMGLSDANRLLAEKGSTGKGSPDSSDTGRDEGSVLRLVLLRGDNAVLDVVLLLERLLLLLRSLLRLLHGLRSLDRGGADRRRDSGRSSLLRYNGGSLVVLGGELSRLRTVVLGDDLGRGAGGSDI